MGIKYRPEIDGLRTIAVLSVIIYHAEFAFGTGKLLPGGFLGVDVFFVISGFLITSLMMKEFHKTGTISIANFYERRARRLIPALFIVMLASMPFAWMYLLPEQLVDYANSLISSLLFGSNFYWNYSLQEYGAESGLLKPFLHTWSLAVEEQFYIVYPLILLAIYKWCKSHTIVLLTAGLLLSLQFAEWMTPLDSSFSFYMLPSRFWELLAGGLLANILHLHPQKENDALLNKTMPMLGLFLILHSIIFTEFDSSHPGFITLFPVIGTMLIIWFANENELVTKLLSSRFCVSIGLISYSLYLWHYPIFVFFRIDDGFDSNLGKIIAIAITFILSVISVKVLEKPFRSVEQAPNKIFIPLVVAVALLIAILSCMIIEFKGYPERYTNIKFFADMTKESINAERKQHQWGICNKDRYVPICGKIKEGKINILVIGDSIAVDGLNILTAAYPQINYLFSGVSGCPIIKDLQGINFSNKSCQEINIARFSKIEKLGKDLDYIVISQRSSLDRIEGVIETINFINKLRIGIVVFGAGPQFTKPVVADILNNNQNLDAVTFNETVIFDLFKQDAIIDVAIKRVGGIHIKKREFFCPNDLCKMIMKDGYPVAFDELHLTYSASKEFGVKLKNQFPNMFEK